jgi:ribosomal protein S18 acetylase RimI-like enzyme
MTDMVLRPYRESDRAPILDAMIAFQNYELTLHDSRLAPTQAMAERYLAELLAARSDAQGLVLVAEIDGVFAGYGACARVEEFVEQEKEDSCIYGYISDIFVAPERRGSGIAQDLIAAMIAHLAALGLTRIRLNVLANNADARRAYEKAGFQPYEIIYEKKAGG